MTPEQEVIIAEAMAASTLSRTQRVQSICAALVSITIVVCITLASIY